MVFYSQKHSGCALLTPTAAAKIRPSPSVAPWQPRNLEVKRIGPYRIVIWLYLLGGFKHEFDVPSYEWIIRNPLAKFIIFQNGGF
jgi:hypothetical protein